MKKSARVAASMSAHGLWRLVGRPSVPPSGSTVVGAARNTVGSDAPTRGDLVLAQGNSCQYLGLPTASSWLMGLGERGLASPHPNMGATHVVGHGWFAGFLHFALFSFWLLTGPDARHRGAGLAGDSISCCVPSVVVRSVVLGVMAGMDQKDIFAAKWWPRSSPTTAVACFLLVLLVDAVRAVFPSLLAGPPAGSGMGFVLCFCGSCFT